MKRIFKTFFIISFFLSMLGCTDSNQSNISMISAPKNSNLKIVGQWECYDYKILDKNVASNEAIFDIFAKDILIKPTSLQVGEKLYNKIEYRLKLVDSDYSLSYEANFKLSDLNINHDNIKVYSVIYQNSLLCEIIYDEDEISYLYYQGILFSISYVDEIDNSEELQVDSEESEDGEDKNLNSSQGLLLGLKEKNKSTYDNTTAQYRTLWISMKDGEVEDVKSKKNIILARRNGFWEVEQHAYEDKAKEIYYEYIIVKSLDTSAETEPQINNADKLSVGKVLRKEINYISSDYVALEIKNNEKFALSPVYSFVPIDNVNTEKSMAIGDLYDKDDVKSFEERYRDVYSSISQENKSKLSKYISYSNFTLVRNKGHWELEGRISPILDHGEPVNFSLGIRPNKTTCNYDILTVPWKVLKGEVPLLVDAFTSPDGSLAVILTNEEVLVYKVIDGKIDSEPSKRIELKDGESVVMAEWSENDYVDKWASAFNKSSSIVG